MKVNVLIVDSFQTLTYAEKYLRECRRLGVDLEGKLYQEGCIDLVQVSGVKVRDDGSEQHKQIFVFDVFQAYREKMQKIDK